MTQWVQDSEGGRDRGPVALGRAWFEVLVRPRQFFRNGVAPGDQAPGLVFGMVVVLLAEGSRLALTDGAGPFADAAGVGPSAVGLGLDVLYLGVAVLIVTPVALHLLSAVGTVVLVVLVENRGGVSETVQVIAYATAPCVFAGLPVTPLRAVCGLYGAYLLLVGVETVHETGRLRAVLVAAIPGIVTFGYGFRTFEAIGLVLRSWYVI